MSGPADDWAFQLTVPEGWISVDLERLAVDRRGDLVAGVERVVGAAPALRDDAVRLVDVAEAVVGEAEERGALVAAVGFEMVDEAVVAYSVAAYGLAGDAPPDVAALAAEMREPHGRDLGGREVAVVDLPAGPAVRVHAISEGAPDPEGRTVVIEAVDHFIPVPGGTDLLLVAGSTPSVAIGDLLLPVFDEIAATVRFDG